MKRTWGFVAAGVAVLVMLAGGVLWFTSRPREIGDGVDWKSFAASFQPLSGQTGWEIIKVEGEIVSLETGLSFEKSPELRASLQSQIETAKRHREFLTVESLRVSDTLRARMAIVGTMLPGYGIATLKQKCPPILDIIAVNPTLYDSGLLAKRLREYDRNGTLRQESPTLADWLSRQK